MEMRTYIIREDAEECCVHLEYAYDAMPPRPIADYSDAESAMRANPDLPWQPFVAEDDGDAGDVLYVARLS
jgi:hypothetical protein